MNEASNHTATRDLDATDAYCYELPEAQIATHAREIYLQAGRSHAMPPGNVTGIEPAERRAIIEWYRAATAG